MQALAQEYLKSQREGRLFAQGSAQAQMLDTLRLDGSIASLGRIDAFLQTQDAHTLTKQQKLFWFLGFYAGSVVQNIAHAQGSWLDETTARAQMQTKAPWAALALDSGYLTDPLAKGLYYPLRPILATDSLKGSLLSYTVHYLKEVAAIEVDVSAVGNMDNADKIQNLHRHFHTLHTQADDVFSELKEDLRHYPSSPHMLDGQMQKTHKLIQDYQMHVQNQGADALKLKKARVFLRERLMHLIEAGHPDAPLVGAGFLFEEDQKSALEWVKMRANQGDGRAGKLLSRLYFQGTYVAANEDLGMHYLSLAAKNGHKEAASLYAAMTAPAFEPPKTPNLMRPLIVMGVLVLMLLIAILLLS